MTRARAYLDGTFQVELGERTIEVELTLRDTLRYEAMEGKSPLAGAAQQGMTSELAKLKLCWLAGRRLGLIDHRRYADFEAEVSDVYQLEEHLNPADEDEDGEDTEAEGVWLPDPTQQEPTET